MIQFHNLSFRVTNRKKSKKGKWEMNHFSLYFNVIGILKLNLLNHSMIYVYIPAYSRYMPPCRVWIIANSWTTTTKYWIDSKLTRMWVEFIINYEHDFCIMISYCPLFSFRLRDLQTIWVGVYRVYTKKSQFYSTIILTFLFFLFSFVYL